MAKRSGTMIVRQLLLFVACLQFATAASFAEEPPSAVGPVMKLLRGGRVPEARLPAIVEIVGTRGNEQDLAFLFTSAIGPGWSDDLRATSFRLLADAASTRKVVPAGDLAPVNQLLAPATAPALQLSAIRFVGAAQVQAASGALAELLDRETADQETRTAALEAYVAVAGSEALPVIRRVLAGDAPLSVRGPALAALAELDVNAAAADAAAILAGLGPADEAGVVVDAFLVRQGGSKKLAEAVAAATLKPDVAKLALRHIYAVGRSDEELVSALGKAAGINDDPLPVTPELITGLIAEVETSGDAARGEAVFRRSDLSCMKCHAVSAGGGQVGPDLSAVGSISPLDYLAMSVLEPDQAIKEAYITRVVATVDGRVLQGILVDRNSERLVLKDATGVVHTIAVADIDDEIEGKSLMPKGLVKFMTRQELVDVVTFLSQLGRPGEYAIRTTPRFQRYRVLARVPSAIGENIPNDEQFEAEIGRSADWIPFYARVNGTLPLDEARRAAGGDIIFLAAEFDVREAGEVELKLSAAGPVTVWLDDDSVDDLARPLAVEPGRHRVTLRIDARQWPADAPPVMEIGRPAGSQVEIQVVDGA